MSDIRDGQGSTSYESTLAYYKKRVDALEKEREAWLAQQDQYASPMTGKQQKNGKLRQIKNSNAGPEYSIVHHTMARFDEDPSTINKDRQNQHLDFEEAESFIKIREPSQRQNLDQQESRNSKYQKKYKGIVASSTPAYEISVRKLNNQNQNEESKDPKFHANLPSYTVRVQDFPSKIIIQHEPNIQNDLEFQRFLKKYGFQVLFIFILAISAAITLQHFINQEKDKMLKDLSETVTEIECLKNKTNSDFQKCDDNLKKKIKTPYLYKPPLMEQPRLTQLEYRNLRQIIKLNSTFNDKLEFAAKMYLNWQENDQSLFQLEYYRLNSEIDMNKEVPLRKICIMSPFRNILKAGTENSSVHMFLRSLEAQNYSKYSVYMIDDGSIDNSTEFIINQLQKYPRLNNRITLLKNNQSYGALANRDSVTRTYCQPGDIVLDIDGDDALIGKQVLNLFNRVYQENPQAWFVYMNFIQIRGNDEGDGRTWVIDIQKAKKGPSKQIPIELSTQYKYRTNLRVWVTSALRSYLYDLYVKVPLNYLINQQTKQYEIKASDRFIMYALSELAGPDHTLYFDYFPYFYYQPNFSAWEKYDCTLYTIIFSEAQSRLLTPLKNLKSLHDKVERIKNYHVPIQIQRYYLERKQKLIECEYQQRQKQMQSII